MEHEDLRQMVERQRRVLVIVWGSMMATLVVYLLIPRLVASEGPLLASGAVSILLRPFFWVLVLFEVLFLNWWKQAYLKPTVLRLERPADEQIKAAISKTTTRGIVAFAIAESIALYGLILALIGRLFLDQFLLTLISGVLMIQLYPSARFFDELVREGQPRGLKP